jgi:DNA-binding MarR family transcriptional regulator
MGDCDSSEALFAALQTLIRGLKIAEGHGAEAAASRLSASDFQALMLIGERQRCIVSDVAQNLNISPTTASSLVDRLVRNNFVERYRSDADRRIVRLELTPDGARIREEAVALQLLHCRQMLDELAPDEAETFVALMQKIGDRLNQRAEERAASA